MAAVGLGGGEEEAAVSRAEESALGEKCQDVWVAF